MTVYSLLDTDLYKLTQSSAYFDLYPNAEGTFTFNDRNQEVYDEKFLEMLAMEFAKLCELRLTNEQYGYLLGIRFLKPNWVEWFKGFHFDLKKINFGLDGQGHLHIDVTDKMYKVTLYEVPILAIVAECRLKWLGAKIDFAKTLAKLSKKIDFANEHGIKFSEFGTRRRASAALHLEICKLLKERCPINCVGTSNVHFAMMFDMMPSGTQAHEWVMFHQGVYGFKCANYRAIEAWIEHFGGDLGILLVDTTTTKSFLHTLTLKQAKLADGFRQDSGDEREIGNMIVDKLREFRIDPMTKTIVFSNALDFEKAEQIQRYFNGIIKTAFGIGTNITCDIVLEDGYDEVKFPDGKVKAANIVMKLSRCRFSPRDFWEPVIKISDDIGKHMGDPELFEIAAKELHLKELGAI